MGLSDVGLVAEKKLLQEDMKTSREEINECIERLVSTGKIPDEELLRIVQGLEEGTANISKEELGQGLATTDDKIDKPQDGLTKTDDKVKQLEHETNTQTASYKHLSGKSIV